MNHIRLMIFFLSLSESGFLGEIDHNNFLSVLLIHLSFGQGHVKLLISFTHFLPVSFRE